MYRLVGLAIVFSLVPIATGAQTITGPIDPEYDVERDLYVYGPLYWDVEVAPAGTRSDEFGLNLYYNKIRAVMLVKLLCPDSDGDLEMTPSCSFSAETPAGRSCPTGCGFRRW